MRSPHTSKAIILVASICMMLFFCVSSRVAGQSAPVMSDRSLQALQQANVYGASIFHVQAPGADFQREMRVAIPRDYAGMDEGIPAGLSNIERDLLYL